MDPFGCQHSRSCPGGSPHAHSDRHRGPPAQPGCSPASLGSRQERSPHCAPHTVDLPEPAAAPSITWASPGRRPQHLRAACHRPSSDEQAARAPPPDCQGPQAARWEPGRCTPGPGRAAGAHPLHWPGCPGTGRHPPHTSPWPGPGPGDTHPCPACGGNTPGIPESTPHRGTGRDTGRPRVPRPDCRHPRPATAGTAARCTWVAPGPPLVPRHRRALGSIPGCRAGHPP